MINCTYNLWDYELLPKRLEIFEKYTKILQWGRANPTRFIEDFLKIQLTDHQKWMILSSWAPSTVVWLCSRATGKLLRLEQTVPCVEIVDGKRITVQKKNADLKLGDTLIGADGKDTKIIQLHPVVYETVWEIELEDGQILEAGPEHLWTVYDFGRRTNERKEVQMQKKYVYETQQLTYKTRLRKSKPEYRYGIPIVEPIYEEEKDFLIEPYILGLWLGDGYKGRRDIACDIQDIDEEIEILKRVSKNGWIFGKTDIHETFGYIRIYHEKDVDGHVQPKYFTECLKQIGVYKNKHIPEEYFHGSYQQKLELLQGLNDSDGYCSKEGNAEFGQKDDALAQQVNRLAKELGIKCTLKTKEHRNSKRQKIYRRNALYFKNTKSKPLFKLSRKNIFSKESCKLKYKGIHEVRETNRKDFMRCITVDNDDGTFLIGDNYIVTHNSFMASVFLMTRALLLPNTNSYIMRPSRGQAQETFQKMEDIAKGNIASLMGTSSVFLDECIRMNSSADPFTHAKTSYSVSLYNGSTINTLNSVAKNIVGIRSNFSVFDEGGKIDRDFYALTLPFTVQNMNFVTGSGINNEIYPTQMQNKNLFLSSAEGIDSYLFDMYKLCFQKMLLGDPDYFVCDIDCNFSLHPFMNGKPYQAQLTQKTVDDAMATNPYRAQREYFNTFDHDGGEDVFVKRSTVLKNSYSYYPVYENDGEKKYIICYDPSSKLDNSVVLIGEIFRDKEKGLMLKLVNCENLIELLPSGEKAIIQKPQQIEMIKDLIINYNRGALDYDNIELVCIDAGAGRGRFDISQFLLNDWVGSDGKRHLGLIDEEDPYMKLRIDDYPANIKKLQLFNFKRDKVQAYERTQAAINQGLVMFPKSLNVRNEMEIEETQADGTITLRYEKVSFDEMNSLIQLDLLKEEAVAMQKYKKPNGTIQFDLSPDARQKNFHDDRIDTLAMMCNHLMELRAQEVLTLEEKPKTEFKEMFAKQKSANKSNSSNPFNGLGQVNPLSTKYRRGGRFG